MSKQQKKGPGRPSGAVSEETRAHIVEAACKCFADHGYAKTSNQEIAKLAGVTTGALYHYFPSKAELFAAVHRYVESVVVEFYRRAFTQEENSVAQICAGAEASVGDARTPPEVAKFASIAPVEIQRHPELKEILEADIRGTRAFFTKLIQRGQERGDIDPQVDTDAAVNMITSCFFGLAWLRAQVDSAAEHAAALRAFQCLLRGELFRT
jgi:AcrR family transcriptional regulator